MADSSYSPRLRTGVVLCGTGTAGAYQAGVLRALAEAGVKIDVVAAHGAGVMTALCAAIDGGAKLWDPAGPWTDTPAARRLPLAPGAARGRHRPCCCGATAAVAAPHPGRRDARVRGERPRRARQPARRSPSGS